MLILFNLENEDEDSSEESIEAEDIDKYLKNGGGASSTVPRDVSSTKEANDDSSRAKLFQ